MWVIKVGTALVPYDKGKREFVLKDGRVPVDLLLEDPHRALAFRYFVLHPVDSTADAVYDEVGGESRKRIRDALEFLAKIGLLVKQELQTTSVYRPGFSFPPVEGMMVKNDDPEVKAVADRVFGGGEVFLVR